MGRAEEVAEILLDIGAVAINAAEPFVYASGTRSPIYCDNRLLMSYPAQRRTVVRYLVQELTEQAGARPIDVVAGVATSGIPFAAWVAEALDTPMVYVRPAPKEHGRQQRVEGLLEPGRRAAVVEDLVTTGGSALETVGGLREAGAVVDCSIAIFTYESPKAAAAFERAKVQLLTLCGISTLLDVATAGGRITSEDAAAVRDWLRAFTAT